MTGWSFWFKPQSRRSRPFGSVPHILTSILRALQAPGRVPALALIALATAVRIWDPAPLREIQFRVFDLEHWAYPRSASGAASLVRIVEIDQDSIGKYGQWP